MRRNPDKTGQAQHDHSRGETGSPAGIDVTGWTMTIKRTAGKFVTDRCTMAAASLAYYWFLSFFPALIAILGTTSLTSNGSSTLTRLLNNAAKALPPGASDVATQAVHAAATQPGSASWTAVAAGLLISLWSASSGMAALQRGLDIAYQVPADRGFIARRLIGIPLILATLILGGTGAALIVLGQPVSAGVQHHLHVSGPAVTIAWTAARWILAIGAITLLTCITYRYGPNRRPRRGQWISIGGLSATVIFLMSSAGFSFYITKFGNFGKTYGAFAGIAIFIFWLFLIGLAVMIGAELNAQIEQQAAPPTQAE
jgi:membrane protein